MKYNGFISGFLPVRRESCEAFMVLPFLYWFYLQVSGRTIFPKGMAFTNVLVIYGILWLTKSAMPDTPFRIGFTNGLMSESMIFWFGIMLVWVVRHMKETKGKM